VPVRIIGFEELGNNDGFETAALELRLATSGKQAHCSLIVRNIEESGAGVIQKTTGEHMRTLYSVASKKARANDDADAEIYDLDD
jgi:hypothetical protein